MFGKVLGSFLALSLLVGCSSDTETTTRTSGGTGAGTGTGIGGSGAGGIFGTAGDTVYFDTDRAVLRDDARATLDRQADYLNHRLALQIITQTSVGSLLIPNPSPIMLALSLDTNVIRPKCL